MSQVAAILHAQYSSVRRGFIATSYRLSVPRAAETTAMLRSNSMGVRVDVAGHRDAECYPLNGV